MTMKWIDPHELEWLANLFEYNTKIILNCKPLKVKKIYEGVIEVALEFRDSLIATLFALHMENYFPIQGDEYTKIHYAFHPYTMRFLLGIDSLRNYTKYFNRNVVFLIDANRAFRYRIKNEISIKQDIHNMLIAAKNLSLNPDQVIICYTWGGEGLYIVLAGFILRDLGYIIFPEGILDHLLFTGVSDMIAIKIPELQDDLKNKGIIEKGAWFAEFELIKPRI